MLRVYVAHSEVTQLSSDCYQRQTGGSAQYPNIQGKTQSTAGINFLVLYHALICCYLLSHWLRW